MCMQILILNVCIYLCTIVMHWFMRIKNLDLAVGVNAIKITGDYLVPYMVPYLMNHYLRKYLIKI